MKSPSPLFIKSVTPAGAAALLAGPVHGADNYFDGSTDDDWTDGTNWSLGSAPNNNNTFGHLFVNAGLTTTIPSGTHPSSWIHVGAIGSAGTIVQAAGSTLNNVNGFRMGRNSGDGTYVMNGTALNIGNEFIMGWNTGTGTHNFIQNTGTVNVTGGNYMAVGNIANQPSTLTLNGGAFNFTNGSNTFVIGQRSPGVLDINNGASLTSAKAVNTGNYETSGNIDISGGSFTAPSLRMSVRGSSNLNVSGGSLDVNELRFGWYSNVSTSGAQLATVTQTGGQVNIGSAVLSQFTTDGTYNLQGGTLGVNNLGIHTGATFNWGEATLSTDTNAASGSTDYSSAGFNVVQSGQTLNVTGANADLATGHDFGGGVTSSTLDLGTLYINSGVRFNQLVTSGELDLSAAGDTLRSIDNPYNLRPNIGTAVESGSLILVDAAGGITGEFDTFADPLQDNIGWEQYTGAFTDAASLPVNSWYLEYTNNGGGADQIIFHYKVEGTVPEPGTVGMLALGLLFVRSMRDRLRRSSI